MGHLTKETQHEAFSTTIGLQKKKNKKTVRGGRNGVGDTTFYPAGGVGELRALHADQDKGDK